MLRVGLSAGLHKKTSRAAFRKPLMEGWRPRTGEGGGHAILGWIQIAVHTHKSFLFSPRNRANVVSEDVFNSLSAVD